MKRRWEEKELRYLRDNYQGKAYADIGLALGRTARSVSQKVIRAFGGLSKEEFKTRMKEVSSKRNQQGENNPNWKGGISENNYHYKKIQKKRYPERIKAREKVARAVKTGKIKKEPCRICGDKNTQAHHEDYEKPLEIIWLCRDHHREMHLKIKLKELQMEKKRCVVVTTDKKGVFFGELESYDREKERCILKDAQMCVYWSSSIKGILGLAGAGPDRECRITPVVKKIELNGITSVIDCTEEAAGAWGEQPWGQ